MIKQISKPFEKKEVEEILDPLVKEWFFSKFKEFSLPQLYGVMPIWQRKNILISAPTGGTKTLTAFLSILNYLVLLSKKKELEDKVYCVYCSPLKALNNDIAVNLTVPLAEIKEIAKKRKIELQEIRIAVRTGDTTIKEKQKQLKKAPHILITTPETLAIILTTTKFIENLKGIEYLIIDEIHALSNKRGTYLSLILERITFFSKITPVRIGLSATVAPLEEIARFLVGNQLVESISKGKVERKFVERDCLIADVQFSKKIDISVLSPLESFINASGGEIQKNLYILLDSLIKEHKTTLIFTNTRAATERVVNHLKEMFPKEYTENIGAHHSSLSKEHRFNIEQRLREGKLKIVATSTSLELGIDIGYIDLVILLSSPKSVARAMQRIGRSGHKLHNIAKGRLVVMDQDDLVECCVLAKEAIEKKIDRVFIPKNCLDVLSQHIYGCVIGNIWKIDELFNCIKSSYCYASLSREDFFSVLSYLSGEYALEHKNVYAKIWYDSKSGEIGKRGKMARVIYMTNIGTIPEESFVNVVLARGGERNGEKIGSIDESFLERMKAGDVFVLGGNKYQFLYSKGMNAYVSGSVNRPPTIPSWASEMLPLSFDLALEINKTRRKIEEIIKIDKEESWKIREIKKMLYLEEKTAKTVYNYFFFQNKYAKIPTEKRLLIEIYKEKGKNFIIFHSLYGRRVNDALSRAIAYILAQTGGRDISIVINDNGFMLSSLNEMNIDRALNFLNSKNIQEILREAIEKTEVFKRRFRHCASRSLMILKNYKGRRKTVGKQQINSFFLLDAIKKIDSNFPILKETRREIMEDLMDIENTKLVLKWIAEEKIKIEKINSDIPSPFSLNLVIQGYSDLIKIEDKFAFLKRIYSALEEQGK
jgi:ATP-dependent Lhr-like helicase